MAFVSPQQWYETARWTRWHGHDIPMVVADNPGKPRLLLIHGFPTASWDWFKIWPLLQSQFSLLSFDMIGFGWADKPVNYEYSIQDQAHLAEAVVREAGWDHCHILAHDYGDSVAQELLARQIEQTLSFRIDKCTLLNGGIIPGVHRPTLTQKLLMTPLGPWISKRLTAAKVDRIFKKIFADKKPPSDEELAAVWQLIEHNGGRAVAHKVIRYMAERVTFRDRWVGALNTPATPLLLIDGMEDPISGAHLVEAYRQLVRQPNIVELQGVGHYPQLEAPQATAQAVSQFMAERAS